MIIKLKKKERFYKFIQMLFINNFLKIVINFLSQCELKKKKIFQIFR